MRIGDGLAWPHCPGISWWSADWDWAHRTCVSSISPCLGILSGMISGSHTKKLIQNHIRNGIKILKQLRSSVLCRLLSVFKTEALFSKPRLQPRLWEVLGYRYEKCTHSFVLNLHCNYPCFVCFHGWEVIRNWKTSDSQNGITTEIWSNWPKL